MKAQFIGADVALTPLSRWSDWVGGVCRDILRSRVAQDWLALGLKKWGRARMRDRVFIGLNVHKATISVAIAKDDLGGGVLH